MKRRLRELFLELLALVVLIAVLMVITTPARSDERRCYEIDALLGRFQTDLLQSPSIVLNSLETERSLVIVTDPVSRTWTAIYAFTNTFGKHVGCVLDSGVLGDGLDIPYADTQS